MYVCIQYASVERASPPGFAFVITITILYKLFSFNTRNAKTKDLVT